LSVAEEGTRKETRISECTTKPLATKSKFWAWTGLPLQCSGKVEFCHNMWDLRFWRRCFGRFRPNGKLNSVEQFKKKC